MQFNAVCDDDPGRIVGHSTSSLDLRAEILRRQEAAAGNLVADAFQHALADAGAQLAVVNAGAIRAGDPCSNADVLLPGPLHLDTLANMLPFGDELVLVEVTATELRKTLEHAVALLGAPGAAGRSSRFLQVANLRFAVDCSGAPQEGQQVGQRVLDLEVANADGTYTDVPTDDSVRYRVATTTYLANGGDGHEWLRRQVSNQGESISELDALVDYVESRPDRTVAPGVEGRISVRTTCARAPGAQ
mgnify:FL=1